MTGNSLRKLGNTQRPFKECSNIYKQVMRETPGSRDARRMAARQASAAHAGGGYTQKWSQLCDASIVISICATAPTADNQAVASGNGRRMLMVICQCDPALEGMWQGMWTSIKEIGTLSQTYIYVRYPSHMGEKLQKLCKVLDTVSVENHKFSAKLVTEGRAKLHHHVDGVKPWELHSNGHKLKHLGKDAIQMHLATCEESLMWVMTGYTYNLGSNKTIDGGAKPAAESIWAPDCQESTECSRHRTKPLTATCGEICRI